MSASRAAEKNPWQNHASGLLLLFCVLWCLHDHRELMEAVKII